MQGSSIIVLLIVRRLARVRKATKMVQGERKKFTKKEVSCDNLKEEKHLEIPLMTVERAWAYAMQVRSITG